jgi:Tfp pilus assembly protein PilF
MSGKKEKWSNEGERKQLRHKRQNLCIGPENTDVRNNLGFLLAIRGRIEASLKEFQKTGQGNSNKL